jgi:hypothetical protein
MYAHKKNSSSAAVAGYSYFKENVHFYGYLKWARYNKLLA